MRRLFIISAHQGAEGAEGAEGDVSDPGSVSYIVGGYNSKQIKTECKVSKDLKISRCSV